jgi:hypothetical protein
MSRATEHREYADRQQENKMYQFLLGPLNGLFEEGSTEALDGKVIREVILEKQEDGRKLERTTMIIVDLGGISEKLSGKVLILDEIGEDKRMALVQMPEDSDDPEGQPEYLPLDEDAVFKLGQQIGASLQEQFSADLQNRQETN